MMNSLDLIAGFFCLVLSFACGIIHIVTNPKHHVWLDLPEYVRSGLFVSSLLMAYRGVNFLGLAHRPDMTIGHINVEGMLPLVVLAYTMLAFMLYILRRTYPGPVWDRLRFFERTAAKDPAPDRLQSGVVAEIARGNHGLGFVAQAGDTPKDMIQRL